MEEPSSHASGGFVLCARAELVDDAARRFVTASTRRVVTIDAREHAGVMAACVPEQLRDDPVQLLVIEPTLLDAHADARLAVLAKRDRDAVAAIVTGVPGPSVRRAPAMRLLGALGVSASDCTELPELDVAAMIGVARRRATGVAPELVDDRWVARLDAASHALDGRIDDALDVLLPVVECSVLDEPVAQLAHDLDLVAACAPDSGRTRFAARHEVLRADALRRLGSPVAVELASREVKRALPLNQREAFILERCLETVLEQPPVVSDPDDGWGSCRAAFHALRADPPAAVAFAERALRHASGMRVEHGLAGDAYEMCAFAYRFARVAGGDVDAAITSGLRVATLLGRLADVVLFETLRLVALVDELRYDECRVLAERVDGLAGHAGIDANELRSNAVSLMAHVVAVQDNCVVAFDELDAILGHSYDPVRPAKLVTMVEMRLRYLLEFASHARVRDELAKWRHAFDAVPSTALDRAVLEWRCELLDVSIDPRDVAARAARPGVDMDRMPIESRLGYAAYLAELSIVIEHDEGRRAARSVALAADVDLERAPFSALVRDFVLAATDPEPRIERIGQLAEAWERAGNRLTAARMRFVAAWLLARDARYEPARELAEAAYRSFVRMSVVHLADRCRVLLDEIACEQQPSPHVTRSDVDRRFVLRDEGLRRIAQRGAIVEYGDEDVIGSDEDDVYILLTGAAALVQSTEGGAQTVDVVPTGSVLGREGSGHAWIALGHVMVSRVPRHVVDDLGRSAPDAVLGLVRALELGLESAREVAAIRGGGFVRERIVRMLSYLARHHGRPSMSGGVLIDVQITQLRFASLVAATRQSVGPVLGELTEAGLLSRRYRRYVVEDLAKLEAFADGRDA